MGAVSVLDVHAPIEDKIDDPLDGRIGWGPEKLWTILKYYS
jgi:hypothetical protein